MGPEDCINLMRSRDVNFRDIKAFEMMTKKLFGRNAVENKTESLLGCDQGMQVNSFNI